MDLFHSFLLPYFKSYIIIINNSLLIIYLWGIYFFMKTIEAFKLFKNSKGFGDLSLDDSDEIKLDFKNVSDIALQDIETLFDIQKIALLNQKKIKITNVCPEVKQILEITGLYKTFSNFMTNPIFISKRLSL